MRVVFLGTGGGMPSRQRGLPSIAIKYSGSLLLFDCGESTQRQILLAALGFPIDTRIFITHLHADHLLGLPGVIYTMNMLGRESPLFIYGPRGIREVVEGMLQASRGSVNFEVIVNEVDPGVIYSERDFTIEACEADHTVEALCYKLKERERPGRMRVEYLESLGIPRGPLWGKLQHGEPIFYNGVWVRPEEAVGPPRPGRVVVYTGDTRPNLRIARFAANADVLIHDATFDEALAFRANEEGHSTAKGAAKIALEANVALLALIHISPRYEGREGTLLSEAREVFPNTILPSDLEALDVHYRD